MAKERGQWLWCDHRPHPPIIMPWNILGENTDSNSGISLKCQHTPRNWSLVRPRHILYVIGPSCTENIHKLNLWDEDTLTCILIGILVPSYCLLGKDLTQQTIVGTMYFKCTEGVHPWNEDTSFNQSIQRSSTHNRDKRHSTVFIRPQLWPARVLAYTVYKPLDMVC